jgi:hypothetical protein
LPRVLARVCDKPRPPTYGGPRAGQDTKMTYRLRRLRMHGLIERITGLHRYRVTRQCCQIALNCTRAWSRMRPPAEQ